MARGIYFQYSIVEDSDDDNDDGFPSMISLEDTTLAEYPPE